VAEARRLELINQRNMELEGLGSSEGRRRGLVEVAELYLADLRARVSPMHYLNLVIRLAHTIAALGERRMGDLNPHDLVRPRSEVTLAGKSHRTANLVESDGESAQTARSMNLHYPQGNPARAAQRTRSSRPCARCSTGPSRRA
jgi:hypothetical protein